ncbi:ATP-binding cassette domain-containing protein [Gracilibacillus xinjiangensis]|uniref:ATP-binding cassette domain-containing protein n=1 Tax=Gracilibacillus xinjiangensis TaxID=1193282 RepID=A0ABV8WZG0_9BACI
MSNYVLEVEQLAKSFKYFQFGPVDLQVEKGTVIGLVGENGSGKSTFFHLVLQLLSPDRGTVHCLTHDISVNSSTAKEKIGYAGNNIYEGYGQLTIKQLAQLVSYWYRHWDKDKYRTMIEKYQINEKEKYQNCSAGTKKKVEFVFAMVHSPQLLLLDEPFSGVDIRSKRKMQEELADFMENPHNAIILSTHQQEEMNALCDYLWIMDQGTIIAKVEKDEILQQWMRVWLKDLPNEIKQHRYVVEYDVETPNIVTNNFEEMEKVLARSNVAYTHFKRMELDEILAYIMEEGR